MESLVEKDQAASERDDSTQLSPGNSPYMLEWYIMLTQVVINV